ncbi:hypothetical protein [Collimonas fungivorans]|uniref:hypothetical protein n=1 Tax=Collimonas fungivorans TaxID=158899 RepID=UPI003FA3B489
MRAIQSRDFFLTQWTNEFQQWAEQKLGYKIEPVLADGFSHITKGGATYRIRLTSAKEPSGFLTRTGRASEHQIWKPEYTTENGDIDANQLIAAFGQPYLEYRIWEFRKGIGEKYLSGFKLDAKKDVIPALIEKVTPTRLMGGIAGYELAEIEVCLRTSHGVATITVPISGSGVWVPPGCGTFQSGMRVALRVGRYTENITQLFAILGVDAIAEVRS